MRGRRIGDLTAVAGLLVMMFIGLPNILGAQIAAALPGVTVTGPLATGTPTFDNTLYGTSFDLSQVGYEASQFFVSGTAHSYVPEKPLTSDGKWDVTTGASAPYTTRIAVYRPVDPSRFNGTVIVEWLNVTGGVDDSPEWTMSHTELIREGFAWVGVSAQQVGVDAAVSADPADYSSLSHPGDSFSYDIFSQAGEAVRANSSLILGGLTPKKLIAAGESQSAFRLMTYIDAVQPIAHVYDGFLVHSQFGTGAPLSQSPQATYGAPSPTTVRSDLGVPVLEFETQTDVSASNLADRTFYGDPRLFRLWEVAGSSHYDYYGLRIGLTDTGNGQGAIENMIAMQDPTKSPEGFTCQEPVNTGGTHWVLDAAIYWLNLWAVDGIAPPQPPYLQTVQSSPVVFARDANGNALGGVRSPQVDAPIAALDGTGNNPAFCLLFGTTVPLSASQLDALYPSHAQFIEQWTLANVEDVWAGYLVPQDAGELINSVLQLSI